MQTKYVQAAFSLVFLAVGGCVAAPESETDRTAAADDFSFPQGVLTTAWSALYQRNNAVGARIRAAVDENGCSDEATVDACNRNGQTLANEVSRVLSTFDGLVTLGDIIVENNLIPDYPSDFEQLASLENPAGPQNAQQLSAAMCSTAVVGAQAGATRSHWHDPLGRNLARYASSCGANNFSVQPPQVILDSLGRPMGTLRLSLECNFVAGCMSESVWHLGASFKNPAGVLLWDYHLGAYNLAGNSTNPPASTGPSNVLCESVRSAFYVGSAAVARVDTETCEVNRTTPRDMLRVLRPTRDDEWRRVRPLLYQPSPIPVPIVIPGRVPNPRVFLPSVVTSMFEALLGVGVRFTSLMPLIIYTGPGSGFETDGTMRPRDFQ